MRCVELKSTLTSPCYCDTCDRFFTHLNELAKLRQCQLNLPLALCSRGAWLRVAYSSGAGCSLTTNGGNGASTRNCS